MVCQGWEDGVDELSFGFDGDVGVFQERCELVADVVCFLYFCFDFSVKSSIFCKYAAEALELGHLQELSAVDVEFAGCSAHLHCLGLADVGVEFAGFLLTFIVSVWLMLVLSLLGVLLTFTVSVWLKLVLSLLGFCSPSLSRSG